MISASFFNFVSQMAHILTGSTLVFGVLFFWGAHPLWYILPAYALVTGVKEFWYDQNYEDPATRGSNLLDFSMYQVGAYAALGLSLLKGI